MRTRIPTVLAVVGLMAALVPGDIAAAQSTPDAVSISAACSDAPRGRFTDVPTSGVHAHAVDCIGWWGVTRGVSGGRYQPRGQVTRDQMASFIARTVDLSGGSLPGSSSNAFSDDDGNTHERAINQLAALEVVGGIGSGRYAPERTVTRAQMASFLARAWEARTGSALPDGSDYFTDDRGDTHERNINRVAAAGLTGGTSAGRYGPTDPVTRAQMGTFLARFLAKLVADGHTSYPPADPVPMPPKGGPGSMPDGTYANCQEAEERRATPVYRGDPGYHPRLDRDGDGIGCES